MNVERPGSESAIQPVHGKVSVRIAQDGMEALMAITPPRVGGTPVSLAQALAELAKAGVTFGLDSALVEQLVKESAEAVATEPARKPTVVAKGKLAVRGQDAVVKYHELLQQPAGYPLLMADGKVDHFQLGLVRNVDAGTVLASKTPATKGTPGTNVLGALVPALDGKEIPLKAGKGCKLSDDSLQVIADISGHAVLNYDGRIIVSPIFEVRGDVDTSTGNVEFIGTVVVRGNINLGFTVKAEMNVEVHGGIDGGIVEAGGDVTVAYGIQGANRGRVTAGGQIKCRFMENADVKCGRDLTVQDGILHSRVRCGGKVSVTGRRGSIIGGSVRAKEEVVGRIIGSNLMTVTEIEVGVSPETRDELETVKRALIEAEEGFRKAQQAVALLRDMEAKNPAEFNAQKREMLMRSLRSQYHFQGQRDQMAARKAALEDEVQMSYLGRVRAYDYVYPGVRVSIGNEVYIVRDIMQRVCFYLNDNHEVTLGTA